MNNEELRNELALLLIQAGIEGISGFLNELMPEIERRPRFDHMGFLGWFKDRNVPFMAKPFGFMRKCIIPDIRIGKFDGEAGADRLARQAGGEAGEKKAFIETDRWLDIEGFDHDEEADWKIDTALNWLLRETDSTIDEIRELHRGICEWLAGKGLLTSGRYLWALTHSKAFKSKGCTEEELEKRHAENVREHEEFLKAIQ